MKAVILCGGQGTRIRDVADDIPKPMIRIGDRPILWHIMRTYGAVGIDQFVLCLGYKSWAIKEYFLNLRAQLSDLTISPGRPGEVHYGRADFPEAAWQIVLAETGLASQTGARLWRVRDHLAGADTFCLTYGDGVADIDVSRVVEFHKSHGKLATVTGVHPPGRFGVMTVEGAAVTSFSEKPQAGEGLINGGYFVFSGKVFDYLDEDPGLILEQQPLQRLAADGQLMLYEHHGFWQPMDTYREWRLLNDLWDSGQAPWRR
ncbi:MAG: Glucose-phosphate cytidylyltransferase [Pseudomonadota bacterium]|jgi:glucose-1-phosphate cytidylyltransferase